MNDRLSEILGSLEHLVAWFIEQFLSDDHSKDFDYSERSRGGYDPRCSGTPQSADLKYKRRLTEALKLFDVTEDGLTRETVRRRYLKLSRTYHPDRNNQSDDCVEKMQLVNEYKGFLEKVLDRREGTIEEDEDQRSSDEQEASATSPRNPNRNIPRNRCRQKAQKEARRQREKRRQARNEAVEQERREAQRKREEYVKQQSILYEQYLTAQLHLLEVRKTCHETWLQHTSRLREREPLSNEKKPLNLVMEYSCNFVGIAIRNSESDLAVELMQNSIQSVVHNWYMEEFKKNNQVETKINDALRDRVLQLLLSPLDDDFNSALHYAVYYRNVDMISYLVQESRRYERLGDTVSAKNVYGLCSKHYAVHDDVIKSHLDRIEQEVEEMKEHRKLMPTVKRNVSKLLGNDNFVPVALAVFGCAIGRMIIIQVG